MKTVDALDTSNCIDLTLLAFVDAPVSPVIQSILPAVDADDELATTLAGLISHKESSSINDAALLIEHIPTGDSSSINVPVVSIEKATNNNVAVDTRKRQCIPRKDDTYTITDMENLLT